MGGKVCVCACVCALDNMRFIMGFEQGRREEGLRRCDEHGTWIV